MARVYVTMKRSVLDPQGQAVRKALAGLGHGGVTDVRQGKYFELMAAHGVTEDEVRAIAGEVLSNPVIEDFRVEMVD